MSAIPETGIRETPRDRLAWAKRADVGRVSVVAVIAGVLVSYGAFAVLVAATVVVAVLGIDADLTDREWGNARNGVDIVAGILLFLAYLFGGYVSERMAPARLLRRRTEPRQGKASVGVALEPGRFPPPDLDTKAIVLRHNRVKAGERPQRSPPERREAGLHTSQPAIKEK